MNNDKRPPKGPTFPQRSQKYSALFDLQDFLEKEVQDAAPGAFYRSFVPITPGLGLESPKKDSQSPLDLEEDTFVTAPSSSPLPAKPSRRPEKKFDINALFDEPIFMEPGEEIPKVSEILSQDNAAKPVRPEKPIAAPEAQNASGIPVSKILESYEADLKSVIETSTEPEAAQAEAPQRPVKLPPKLPKVSITRRLLAAVVDQIFVLTLWAIAIVITSNVLNDFQSGFSIAILRDFSNPLFQRFAILEFGALWMAYFAVSVGVMDLTFGMWVWGLRVSYGSPQDSQYWMRRMMRVIWSFFFFAPILPAFLLMIRRKGRNLLDVLSGTNLYVAA